jgi:hypothetical protein
MTDVAGPPRPMRKLCVLIGIPVGVSTGFPEDPLGSSPQGSLWVTPREATIDLDAHSEATNNCDIRRSTNPQSLFEPGVCFGADESSDTDPARGLL